jgi:hypothetical protein
MQSESIDINKMLERSKKRLAFESKSIKKMALYNFLNDGLANLIIDCRKDFENNIKQEGGYIRNSFHMQTIKLNEIALKTPTRLILIMNDSNDLKTDESLDYLRAYIKEQDLIDSIYIINQDDYREFVLKCPFFLINKDSDSLKVQIASTSFPLLVIDGIIYTGNFLNSKNIYQLKELDIKCIISMLKEKDFDLHNYFLNTHHIETDEVGHGEIDFNEAIDLINSEIQASNIPILIYCFSGQSLSIALCIAYLMKTKNWSLEFSTAYMMKIQPNLKLPSWLYTQLQRL